MHDVSFRPVQPEDLPQLAVFCSQFPGDGRSVEFWTRRFQHWWQDNPAMTDDWLRGYQLFVDGVLQGVNLTIPLRVVVEGVPHTASLGSTWRVMPKHRAWSMAVAHEVNIRHDKLLRFNGTPSERVRKIIKGSYQRIRGDVQASLLPANPLTFLFKFFGFKIKPKKLPPIILPKGVVVEKVAAEIEALWKNKHQSTGPVRDWNYWLWFSQQKSNIQCSTVILPSAGSHLPVCGILAEFGDGKLQISDIWPLDTTKDRLVEFIELVLANAWKSGFHSLLIPHWTNDIKSACLSMRPLKDLIIPADVWTNPFSLPVEPNAQHWPLHTGDALL